MFPRGTSLFSRAVESYYSGHYLLVNRKLFAVSPPKSPIGPALTILYETMPRGQNAHAFQAHLSPCFELTLPGSLGYAKLAVFLFHEHFCNFIYLPCGGAGTIVASPPLWHERNLGSSTHGPLGGCCLMTSRGIDSCSTSISIHHAKPFE